MTSKQIQIATLLVAVATLAFAYMQSKKNQASTSTSVESGM